MPKSLKKLVQLSLAVLLASSSALGLVARQTSNLTSGSYTLGAISVPGFDIGAISGSYVGVEDPTNLQPVRLVGTTAGYTSLISYIRTIGRLHI